MKSLLVTLLLTTSALSYAASVEVAAFTAFYYCQNDEVTQHEEMCMISIYHPANISIPLTNGSGEVLLDHSNLELSLDLRTKVIVKQISDSFHFTLFTFRDGVEIIGPLEVSTQSIETMETRRLYGKDICVNTECTRYFRPFLYLSQPWERVPESL